MSETKLTLDRDDWSRHASRYSSTHNGESLSLPMLATAFDKHFFSLIDALLHRKRANEDDSPLDILCLCGGPGPEALLLCRRYSAKDVRVLTTDFAQGMVDESQAMIVRNGFQDRAKSQVVDAMNIPFDKATFDVVTLILGPMLLPDANRCFSSVNRVLKSGGVFLTLTPGEMDIHDVMFAQKQTVLDLRGKGEQARNAFFDNIVAKWGTPTALCERLEQSTFFTNAQAASDQSYARFGNENELVEVLSQLSENPGMRSMYISDLSEQEAQCWQAAVRDEFTRRFKSSPSSSVFGLKMTASSAWAVKS